MKTVKANFEKSAGKISHQKKNFVSKLLWHKPKISTVFLDGILKKTQKDTSVLISPGDRNSNHLQNRAEKIQGVVV